MVSHLFDFLCVPVHLRFILFLCCVVYYVLLYREQLKKLKQASSFEIPEEN